MPSLRYSRFNHLVRVPGEDAWALYSFATGWLDVLDAPRKGSFDRAPGLPPSSPEVGAWVRAGFLTSLGTVERITHWGARKGLARARKDG